MLQHHYPEMHFFLQYLQFEKKYSQHTLLAYEKDLEQFTAYIISQYEAPLLQDIKAPYVRSWLAHLKSDKTLTNKSVNRKISTLKSFFKYLMKNGIVQQTPMTVIISPKINRRLPMFVEEKDIQTYFKEAQFSDDHKGRTEELVLRMLYETGMRLSELIHLKKSSIDVAYQSLRLLGKGNKERLVPVSQTLLSRIKKYIDEKPIAQADVDAVFTTEKGKLYTPKTIYNSVKKHLSLATSIEKKSPHILRHTFATHLMNHGAELNAVKELLGHSSLAATQVYTHLTIEKLKEVHKMAHPKA